MPRQGFDRQLREIQQSTLLLGSMAAMAVERAIDALKRRDANLAQSIIDNDGQLDDLALCIEERALLLIATQQPIAGDLRIISAVIAIVGELERIGDYAEGIAKLALQNLDEPPVKPLVDIPRMAELSIDMLRRSLDAFIAHDTDEAAAIWSEDDEVDELQDRVYRDLLQHMREDTATIGRATRLLWVAHNLERIADRVTNICERVVFMVSGNRIDPAPHGTRAG
ncbi:MAG: Phosphate transport system regulatory protein PhoU [uncultured Thermomicrobiales bacterium]|uniref:Phosphate-specific transport system accessory protein PhoU n=1 Tax=uncultured Thermomicrobiales bacterium TaxID=1645740 RepID=A0A6J4UNT0_9BACT|nr:MAG: Phosphate transport system regulatory protein PhoU [uncultured Thermomicrobiales bacterium]